MSRFFRSSLRLPVVVLFLFFSLSWALADGTRNFVEPADTIGNGLSWQNEASLFLFNGSDGNYYKLGTVEASENQRFYIHIADPSTEVIYLGFNQSYNPQSGTVYFRIKAPDGTLVQDYTAIPTSSSNGYISSYKQLFEGPSPTVTSGGYSPLTVSPDPTQSGDYYIEFNNTNSGNTVNSPMPNGGTGASVIYQMFDVSVGKDVIDTGSKTHDLVEGRFFAYQYPMVDKIDGWMNQDGVNVDYYVYHDVDQVVTKLHWEHVTGGGWVIQFNDHGPQNIVGDLEASRKSVSSSDSELATPKFPIFFAVPDESVYVPTTVEPDFNFEDYRFDCESGDRAFFFTINRTGRLEILMEFGDGYDNGYYDLHTTDRILIVEDVSINRNKVIWDGLDGSKISRTSAHFTVNMQFSIGSMNNPMFDVEAVRTEGGLKAELVSPTSFGWDTNLELFYDDSNVASLGTSNYQGSTSLSHTYPYADGDKTWVNSWWTAYKSVISQTITVDASPGIISVDTIWGTNPTSCSVTDGEIYIEGLIGGDDYDVTYDKDGVTIGPATYTADGSGFVIISGLSQGAYDEFVVESGSCIHSDASTLLSLSCVDANDALLSCQENPGGTVALVIPNSSFSGSPYASNALMNIAFETFPANANSLTINGVTYYNQSDMGLGVEHAANADGSSTVSVSVDPLDDVESVVVYYRLKDNQGTYSGEAQVTLPFPTMSLSVDVTTTSCEGGNSGELDLTVFGGSAPYSYLWTPGDYTSEDVSGLSVGTYTVVVTDDNGCSVTDSFEVTATPLTGTCSITEGAAPSSVSTSELLTLNSSAITGTSWSNLTNMLDDDGAYASTSIGSRSDANMIYANSFDFSAIPDEATIDGLEVSINRYSSGNGVRDDDIQFEVNGSVGDDYANNSTNWTTNTSEETETYGGDGDLWGFTSISRSDLNTLELQYLLRNNNRNSRTAYIDQITIRVYYTTTSSYVDNDTYTFSINAADYPEASGFSWSISRSAIVESVSADGTTATFDLNNRGGGDYDICVTPYNACGEGTPCCTTISVVDDGGGGSILGTVFADVDLDGILGISEPGVDSILVLLYEDKDGNGTVSASDTQVDSEFTDSLGNYLFTVFESVQEDTVRDEFSVDGSYSGSDGSENWAGDWTVGSETYIYVSSNQFVFHYIWTETAYREVDLSGATSATLSFDWSSSGLDVDEELQVEISSDGGSNYTSLASFGYSPTSGTFSQDITAYIASNTRIRFSKSDENWESGEYVYIEDVSIIYSVNSYADYVLEVDLSSLPTNADLTTDNLETAELSFSTLYDEDNDFGIASADLSITKDDGETIINAGDGMTHTYTLLLTNNGPTNATNVVVEEFWPSAFTQTNIGTPSHGIIGGTAPDFTWSFASLAAGQADSVKVNYTVPLATTEGDYSNLVIVSSDTDPYLSNDSALDITAIIDPFGSDFGDAPSSYDVGTPASHEIKSTPLVYLGSIAPDKEDNAQSGLGVDDDNTDTDDEDAFSYFAPYTTMRSSYTLHVPITNISGDSVTVSAWIDMNGDGVFDVSERTMKTVESGTSSATLVWNSLPVLTQGLSTYIRLRVASDKTEVENPTGSASDGELEDYPFEIYYAGDCPTEAFLVQDNVSNWYDVNLATASYTLANDNYGGKVNGVGYNLLDGLIYGYENTAKDGRIALTSVNASTTPTTYKTYLVGPIAGLPTGTGYYVGDVGNGKLYLRSGGASTIYVIDVDPDSPDYLSSATALAVTGATGSYTDMVYLPSDDMIYALNNSNGALHQIDPSTGLAAIIDNASVPNATYGAQYLDVNGFMYASDNSTGDIYRVSLTGNPDYKGVLWAVSPASGQNDGSRCPLAPVPIDFGDAPESYITEVSLGGQMGARHAVPLYNDILHTAPLMIGDNIDIEIDGQPSVFANGDDNDGVDDEDGVAAFETLSTGSTSYSTTVSVLNNTGGTVYLSGYIDFDGDSLFNADERADATITISQSSNQDVVLNWIGLGSTIDVNSGISYMRLRLSSEESEVQVPNGIATDGEVEDHMLVINAIQTDSVTKIGETTASLYGAVIAGDNIEEYGFYYSTSNNPSNLIKGSAIEAQAYAGAAIDIDSLSYSSDVSSLTNRSAYYFRAYMKDASDQYIYGDVHRFVSERRDFSLVLDGSGDALIIDEYHTDNTINNWGAAANTFSVDFWIKKGSSSTAKQVLLSDMSASSGYLLALTNGHIVLENHSAASVQSTLQINDQEWHHIALSYDNGSAELFIDDSVSATLAIVLTRPSLGDANCFIGAGFDGTDLEDEFQGYLDAMRFWNVALDQSQVEELLYDNIHEGTIANTVEGVGSGRLISSLSWNNLTASIGFNVMSTQESATNFPVSFNYALQEQMQGYPFFHNDARLAEDAVAFNIVACGDAKPSPYLPRVYWRSNNMSSAWLSSNNWSGYAFPGEGVSAVAYPDVTSSDFENDSAYCKFTIVDVSTTNAIINTTPPEVQVLIDRDANKGTYYVDDSASELFILQGIYHAISDVIVDAEQGAIIVEEGATEVF